MADEIIEETNNENQEEITDTDGQTTDEGLSEGSDKGVESPDTEGDNEGEVDKVQKIDPDEYEVKTRNLSEDEPIEYGEEIDPDDAKTIGAVVEKQTASVKARLQDTQDRLEVDEYLQSHPELSKYKPVILKHMKHPAYKQIPVKNIAAMVASEDLMKLGAKAEREAQAKADATKVRGTQVRKTGGGAEDWKKAPKEAFEEQVRKVKGMNI
jgi:hypothetical protein